MGFVPVIVISVIILMNIEIAFERIVEVVVDIGINYVPWPQNLIVSFPIVIRTL